MKLRCASALSLLFCLAAILPAQAAAPPDTPQGRRLKALLAAFEAGTPEAVRTFISANFSPAALEQVPLDQRVQRLSGIVKQTGPLEFHSIVKASDTEPVYLLRQKKSGDWTELGLVLDPASGYAIRGLRFEESDGPGAARETKKGSDAEVAAAARAHLEKLAAERAFSGVVLLAKNGKPFFHEAYGMADRGLAVPNRRDTKFNLGSINKAFTQTALAQLAEKEPGKLSFSDTIRKHLPESVFPLPEADRITLQQLVTMSGGLGDFFGPKFTATPKGRIRTLADYLAIFASDPILYAPGTSRRYSNAGYVILGLIIEKVSGKSYYDYVRENIYGPAGMKDSDSYFQDAIVENRAVGYTLEDEDEKKLPQAVSNMYMLPARGSSAGGGYSTAEDLLRFDMAMRGGKLLGPGGVAWFYSDQSIPPAPAADAGKARGGRGIAGGTSGVNAVVEMDVDTGYTVVVLSNIDPPSAEKVSRTLRRWMGLD
jgi:CubicO group peptidase (beta-lactamase class C family)